MLTPGFVCLSRHRPQASRISFGFGPTRVFAQWELYVSAAGKTKLFGLWLSFICSFEHLALFYDEQTTL